jgi:hypothetical protein
MANIRYTSKERSEMVVLYSTTGHSLERVQDEFHLLFPNNSGINSGPVAWPPRSPDLTPLDFFVWGFIKRIVYATQPTDIDDLKERINYVATELITPDFLANVRRDWNLRIHQCLHVNGEQFEHLRK